MKTDTPETNSHLGSLANSPDDTAMWLEIGLPRQLERERDEARRELQRVKAERTHTAPPLPMPPCPPSSEVDTAPEQWRSQCLVARIQRDEALEMLRRVGLDRLERVSITSCDNCPFYANKYCGLSHTMNSQHGTDFPTFVANEWKQGVAPSRCPLRKSDMLFSLEDAIGDARSSR
jgi:hypothetical protein